MDARETGTLLRSSTSYWRKLRRGPWATEVVDRLLVALDHLAKRLTARDDVAAVSLFGSYARGEYGRKSDVDLRLSRQLHGTGGRSGIIQPPALTLGRGALLVPGSNAVTVRDALDAAGASYDVIPVWRDV